MTFGIVGVALEHRLEGVDGGAVLTILDQRQTLGEGSIGAVEPFEHLDRRLVLAIAVERIAEPGRILEVAGRTAVVVVFGPPSALLIRRQKGVREALGQPSRQAGVEGLGGPGRLLGQGRRHGPGPQHRQQRQAGQAELPAAAKAQ